MLKLISLQTPVAVKDQCPISLEELTLGRIPSVLENGSITAATLESGKKVAVIYLEKHWYIKETLTTHIQTCLNVGWKMPKIPHRPDTPIPKIVLEMLKFPTDGQSYVVSKVKNLLLPFRAATGDAPHPGESEGDFYIQKMFEILQKASEELPDPIEEALHYVKNSDPDFVDMGLLTVVEILIKKEVDLKDVTLPEEAFYKSLFYLACEWNAPQAVAAMGRHNKTIWTSGSISIDAKSKASKEEKGVNPKRFHDSESGLAVAARLGHVAVIQAITGIPEFNYAKDKGVVRWIDGTRYIRSSSYALTMTPSGAHLEAMRALHTVPGFNVNKDYGQYITSKKGVRLTHQSARYTAAQLGKVEALKVIESAPGFRYKSDRGARDWSSGRVITTSTLYVAAKRNNTSALQHLIQTTPDLSGDPFLEVIQDTQLAKEALDRGAQLSLSTLLWRLPEILGGIV